MKPFDLFPKQRSNHIYLNRPMPRHLMWFNGLHYDISAIIFMHSLPIGSLDITLTTRRMSLCQTFTETFVHIMVHNNTTLIHFQCKLSFILLIVAN